MFSLPEAAQNFNQAPRTHQEVEIKSSLSSAPKAHRRCQVIRERRALGHSRAAPADTGAGSALGSLPALPRHSPRALRGRGMPRAAPVLPLLRFLGRAGGGLACPAAGAVWGEPTCPRAENLRSRREPPGSGQPCLGWEGGPDPRTGCLAGLWKPWGCAGICGPGNGGDTDSGDSGAAFSHLKGC